MQKAFALLLMVGALWLGLTIYTQGWPGPLGPILAPLGIEAAPADATSPEPLPRRVQERVKGFYEEHEARTRDITDRD